MGLCPRLKNECNKWKNHFSEMKGDVGMSPHKKEGEQEDAYTETVSSVLSSWGCYTVSSQNGWSSLMAASLNGHVEVVDKLLQHGATVDLKDNVVI